MENTISLEVVIEYLFEKRYAELRALTATTPPQDLAELLSELDRQSAVILFRLLSKEQAANTFVELDADDCRALIDGLGDRELSEIMSELYVDDAVDIIEEMPAGVVKRLLRSTSAADREAINLILRYPKQSAGSVMTTEYVRLLADMTVTDALAHIRRVAIDSETIYTCYITDGSRRLIGSITAKQLLISNPATRVGDIMKEEVIFAYTEEDREEVARRLDKYDLLAIPIVDREGRLVGIITVDDAIDVITEASEADFKKMAAITPTGEASYLKTNVFSIWRARIPWLLLLMVSATLSSTILSGFESALPAVLVLFVPMLMDTGGNSGGQASVTVTRGISLGEIEFVDLPRVLLKELTVGTMCALTLGAVAFMKVMLVDRFIMANSAVTVTVALAVALALAMAVIFAKLVGSALPILAKRVGFDPAVMASPLITTLVDALSLVLYFVIAKALLPVM